MQNYRIIEISITYKTPGSGRDEILIIRSPGLEFLDALSGGRMMAGIRDLIEYRERRIPGLGLEDGIYSTQHDTKTRNEENGTGDRGA